MDQSWINPFEEALEAFKPFVNRPGGILVVGCSTSEVAGHKIGTRGSQDIAEGIYQVLHRFATAMGVSLAIQCCEHLNRALVVPRKLVREERLEEVSVIPIPEAGGALAAVAYQKMEDAVVVESILADYGLDIGDTLIGMHLKAVAVPVRLPIERIGHAHLTAATTRPKRIGGARAKHE